MTRAAPLPLSWAGPALLRAKQLGLTGMSWLVAANLWTGGPLFGLWVGSQTQSSGSPSMSSIGVALTVMAAVNYGFVGLLWQLGLARDRLDGTPPSDGARVPWLYRGRARPHVTQREAHARPRPASRSALEPLVLIDGAAGAERPWESVVPQLEFGFDVLAAVLPRDGSIDGTARAMDRAGWRTAHVVARPEDALAAVELARRGRARSLYILEADPLAGDPAGVATAITEFAAFRPVD